MPETQELLSKVQNEIDAFKTVILSGQLLPSVGLEKEYCHSLGSLKAFEVVKEYIEQDNQEDKDEDTND